MIDQSLLVKYHSPEIARRANLKYAKRGDAGLDLYNASGKEMYVMPGTSVEVPAGISVKIPDGYVGLLRCRSSTFARRGLFVVHGTIDSGYVGPLFTHVWHPRLNSNDDVVVIRPWERLSQLIIVPYLQVNIVTTDDMPTTERGQSGFGSSGF